MLCINLHIKQKFTRYKWYKSTITVGDFSDSLQNKQTKLSKDLEDMNKIITKLT